MSLGTNIKDARKKAHLTQMELAKRTNLSRSYIGDIEKNRYNPSINTLKAIARATLTSVSELTDGQNIDVAQTRIPVVGSVRAGIPNDAIEDIIDYEEIAPEMAMRGKMFGLKIRGDSMEPRIKDGDVVIVLETPDVENGDLAVVLVNGNDATIKQISKTADALTLIPFNTSYTPMVYTAEQCKTLPVQIIGKVIELRAKF